jgi:hypothetical protein
MQTSQQSSSDYLQKPNYSNMDRRSRPEATMRNHPGRDPGSVQLRMTPEHLRDLIGRAGLTQDRAAVLAGVKGRIMRQYLSGDRAIPLSASGLLCVSFIMLGAPVGLLSPWLPPETSALMRLCASSDIHEIEEVNP